MKLCNENGCCDVGETVSDGEVISTNIQCPEGVFAGASAGDWHVVPDDDGCQLAPGAATRIDILLPFLLVLLFLLFLRARR